MTLDEAIEILNHDLPKLEKDYFGGTVKAIKLGINALIFYRKLKALNTGEIQGNFLGETEE